MIVDDEDDGTTEEEFLDCTGAPRMFKLGCHVPGFLQAVELRDGAPTGLRFLQRDEADGTPAWGRLRDRVRARLAQRDVVRARGGLTLLRRRVRGQIQVVDDDLRLLVDNLELSWDQVGEVLKSYSGWGLRIEVCDLDED